MPTEDKVRGGHGVMWRALLSVQHESSARAAPNAESSPQPSIFVSFFFLIAYVRKIDNFVCLFLIQFNTNEGPIKIVKRQYQYIKIYTMDFKNQYCNKT